MTVAQPYNAGLRSTRCVRDDVSVVNILGLGLECPRGKHVHEHFGAAHDLLPEDEWRMKLVGRSLVQSICVVINTYPVTVKIA